MQSETALRPPALAMQLSNVVKTFVLRAMNVAASAIAAASPTPGGLGAIEAALVAGLTGVGLGSGPAVSAVLTYRLATYWLPVAPGWIALHALPRRDYV
jgi:undecaprenyl-diphosphatase